MIDKAVEEMKKRRDDEDKLINKHIEEARIKAERTEEIKREKKEVLDPSIIIKNEESEMTGWMRSCK